MSLDYLIVKVWNGCAASMYREMLQASNTISCLVYFLLLYIEFFNTLWIPNSDLRGVADPLLHKEGFPMQSESSEFCRQA